MLEDNPQIPMMYSVQKSIGKCYTYEGFNLQELVARELLLRTRRYLEIAFSEVSLSLCIKLIHNQATGTVSKRFLVSVAEHNNSQQYIINVIEIFNIHSRKITLIYELPTHTKPAS